MSAEQPARPADAEARLRGLFSATTDLVGELSLAAVLRRVVEAARDLVGVEFGALGVIAPDRDGLEQFVHVGIDEATVARIGHLPRGEGLLGALIEDPRPIRLRRLHEDARSAGLPAHHPVLESFLGVPVRVRGRVFGNLYLAGQEPRDFTDEDVELVSALAAAAGIAIENARLFEEARLRQAWLEQTSRLTRELVVGEEADAHGLVARTAHALSGAARVGFHVPGPPVRLAVGLGEPTLPEEDEQALADWVLHHRAPLRRDEDGELESTVARSRPELVSEPATVPLLAVPFVGAGGSHGALVMTRTPGERGFTAEDVDRVGTFAGHVSLALEVAARRRDLERIQLLEDRARIARDLHDHVIQQLFAAGMTVQGVTAALGPDDAEAVRLLEGVVDLVDEAVGQIRTSIFHLRTRPEDVGGVRATVLDVVDELGAALGHAPQVRFVGPVDAVSDAELTVDVGAVVREALANVARHAGADRATVTVRAEDHALTVTVADDGRGAGPASRPGGHGLANLADRAGRRGGTLSVSAPPRGTGTVVTWSVPSG